MSLVLPAERLVTSYHGYRGRFHFALGARVAEALSNIMRKVLVAPALRRSRRVTLVSESLCAEAQAARLERPARVIQNGVDFGMDGVEAGETSGRYLLYVGRIDPDKFVDTLLEMYSSSALGIELWLAGDGTERSRLERLYRGNSAIRFLGMRSRAEVSKLLADAIAFVTASRYETFCLPVIEAAIRGRPSIGPASGALPEVIRDGDTGFLYLDGAGFRRAVARVLSQDDRERARSAASCRAWSESFSWKHRAAEYLDVYEAVAATTRGGTAGRPRT
jgi:glycosyltransferase involved in cell wall biosynthesis